MTIGWLLAAAALFLGAIWLAYIVGNADTPEWRRISTYNRDVSPEVLIAILMPNGTFDHAVAHWNDDGNWYSAGGTRHATPRYFIDLEDLPPHDYEGKARPKRLHK